MPMNLKQLAEHLGLSQTTVSRALNGYAEVSETTRLRVQKAAEAGNYRPNQRALRLAKGKAMTIGHVIPLSAQSDVLNPIFSEFIAAASSTYSAHGYQLMLSTTHTGGEDTLYRSLAATRAVDGVLLHSPLKNDPRIAGLRELGLPFVVHGRALSEPEENYCWVDMDSENAFKLATQLLLDLGHRRIALLNGIETMTYAWLRRCGYLEALATNDVQADDSLMTSAELTETYGYKTATEMLKRNDRPTAFLVSSYIVALGVRRAISQCNLVIGKDVSVVIHDDELSYFDNGSTVPQFTSTRSSVKDAGHLAAEALIKLIENPDQKPESKLVPTQLVIGSSTGQCKP